MDKNEYTRGAAMHTQQLLPPSPCRKRDSSRGAKRTTQARFLARTADHCAITSIRRAVTMHHDDVSSLTVVLLLYYRQLRCRRLAALLLTPVLPGTGPTGLLRWGRRCPCPSRFATARRGRNDVARP